MTSPILVAVGTRPEIIKMAPVITALEKARLPFIFFHCGQHYDYVMSQQFIEELKLPPPDVDSRVNETDPALQTAHIMEAVTRTIIDVHPSMVLVEGDTNTVLASAVAANKLKVPLGHVEAGLRSYDLRMPEEHNRRLTDHLSTHLYAPTKTAQQTLRKEDVWGKIFLTGNTIIDAVLQHLPIAEETSQVLSQIKFDDYVLATEHRQENVDDPVVLRNLIEIFTKSPIPTICPVHPRTRKRLEQNGLWHRLASSKNVQLLPPSGYFDFLVLMKNSTLIITDSGGIQEEATAPLMRKRVLVTRLSTERPEAVEAGFAKLVGVESGEVLKSIDEALNENKPLPDTSPFGDGSAAERIAHVVERSKDDLTEGLCMK
jgi:UDP-N-acetylglucosamine 2-epimerase (non-hydrolysing)